MVQSAVRSSSIVSSALASLGIDLTPCCSGEHIHEAGGLLQPVHDGLTSRSVRSRATRAIRTASVYVCSDETILDGIHLGELPTAWYSLYIAPARAGRRCAYVFDRCFLSINGL